MKKLLLIPPAIIVVAVGPTVYAMLCAKIKRDRLLR